MTCSFESPMETIKRNQPQVFFCSDLHIGHKNILKHCPGRLDAMRRWAWRNDIEFPTDEKDQLDLMERWIIDVWNSTVSKKDSVYILGDFSFKPAKENEKLLSKLHGKKYLILGNHDGNVDSLSNYFQYIKQIAEYKAKGYLDGTNTVCFELCHFPMRSWNRMQHGTLHLHGHCHDRLSKENFINGLLRVDVGWDSILAGYGLVSVSQIIDFFRMFTKEDETFEEYHKRKMEQNWFQKKLEHFKNKRLYKKYAKK